MTEEKKYKGTSLEVLRCWIIDLQVLRCPWTLEIMPSGGSYLSGQDSIWNFEVGNKQSEAAGSWQKKKQAIEITPRC